YPGVYMLEPYTELQDLLDLAGTKETADLDVLNPQTVLKDGDCVIIRAKDRPAGRVSINTGTLEDLCTLPGIGETTAAKIIEYRETNGYYQTLEDIKKVKGIGDKKYENIENLICL
ncbi:MAG: helix-hairpin-helix domain-containing protein, partial [Solobacterium sp.]|nr:helix-hairpin-helix domain-containing protein [Solobacterium sp.]